MNIKEKAKEFAILAHKGQVRKSDKEKPMIIHPINVGLILEEYEFDLWNQMDQLKDGAEIMGYSDGFDYVNDTMRLASEGVIEPTDDYIQKVYDRPEETSTTSSSNDSNSSNSSNGSRRNRYRTDEDVDYSDTWDKARKRSQNPDRKTTMDDI